MVMFGMVLQGFRTGYTYLDPLVRKEPTKVTYLHFSRIHFWRIYFLYFLIFQMPNDVELPPTVSNLSYLLEDDALDGPLKVASCPNCL